jgi:hypothetical protein
LYSLRGGMNMHRLNFTNTSQHIHINTTGIQAKKNVKTCNAALRKSPLCFDFLK